MNDERAINTTKTLSSSPANKVAFSQNIQCTPSPPPPPPPPPQTSQSNPEPAQTPSNNTITSPQSHMKNVDKEHFQNKDDSHDPLETCTTIDYLGQLVKDKRQIMSFPNVFMHVERLIDKEINNVRSKLYEGQENSEDAKLPIANGQIVNLSEKIYIPTDEYPDFNFIGRILGPRGMTAKQLENETGCKIMVRGKGSIRDRTKEEQMKDKPNWQHLSDNLHVLISCEDYENRARSKLNTAIRRVRALLQPKPEGEDELKKRQLIELAILNGTYRDNPFVATQFTNDFTKIRFIPNIFTTGALPSSITIPPVINSVTNSSPLFLTSTNQNGFTNPQTLFQPCQQPQLQFANNQAIVTATTSLPTTADQHIINQGAHANMFDNNNGLAHTIINPALFYLHSQPIDHLKTAKSNLASMVSTGSTCSNGPFVSLSNHTNSSSNNSNNNLDISSNCQSVQGLENKGNAHLDAESMLQTTGPIRLQQQLPTFTNKTQAPLLIHPRVHFQGMPVHYQLLSQHPYTRSVNQC